jgi:predicted enzyme involved in methoxymalonyl-ACP biosynthesis
MPELLWNIGPDPVIFLDDDPREIAEMRAAFRPSSVSSFRREISPLLYDRILHLRYWLGKSALIE